MNILGNPDNRAQIRKVFFFLAGLLLIVKLIRDQNKEMVFNQVTGQTMGSIQYNIKYKTRGEVDYKSEIDSLLSEFNNVLSTYVENSEISQFNRTNSIVFESELFYPVLEKSLAVNKATNGAFDPTIGPLVNAWGFGPDKVVNAPAPDRIEELLRLVDYSQIKFDQYHVEKPEGVYLDFSAIAKGYAVDIVGDFLEKKNIKDYMVEIGGEVRTKGKNDKGNIWAIGIEDPLVEKFEQRLLAIASIEDRAIATSGNYRNYYEKDGKIYAHIIDPRTGYTNDNTILSASVFADECMTADAYATAFMVLGVDGAIAIVERNPDLDAFLIYRGDSTTEFYFSEGIKDYINLLATE